MHLGNTLFGEESEKCLWKQSLHVLKNKLVYDENEEMHLNIESVGNKYIRLYWWNALGNLVLFRVDINICTRRKCNFVYGGK
jgi:hypothetical protein